MGDDWHAKLVWSRQKAEGQLDELVHRLGLEGTGYSALGLKLKGQRVTVRLEFEDRTRLDDDDGLLSHRVRERRLVSVFVHAKFEQRAEQQRAGTDEEEPPDSAPSIELRRETDADRADKRAGLTKEIQTGFAGFDRTVFEGRPRARWLVTGASTQPQRVADPIPVAVDHLERALDAALQRAHELGIFEALANST